jgi:hypothetical protein
MQWPIVRSEYVRAAWRIDDAMAANDGRESLGQRPSAGLKTVVFSNFVLVCIQVLELFLIDRAPQNERR